MIGELNSNVPAGDIADKWTQHKFDMKLVAPHNRRKFEVIVIGSGLAGASAAATLGEQGYKVKVITYHDSPRRAHSIAAQGGINAAKNYKADGDSVHRLFYDTVKGGDFRSREANVHRLAEVSVDIIDQMVAQGVPFAREYGGLLDNRSFGGAQGYKDKVNTDHDSPRRAHSSAAQGGSNAAKNDKADGDAVHRLFYDTVKGGDFRSREANVHRLAEVSVDIIDQMVAQGVPFAREYGGLLDNRSFGGAQVSRTFYARGQTGQQLLPGAYQQIIQQGGQNGRARGGEK